MGGLLIGPEDLKGQKADQKAGRVINMDGKGEADEVVAVRRHTRGKVEEVIVALAEVMEEYLYIWQPQRKLHSRTSITYFLSQHPGNATVGA